MGFGGSLHKGKVLAPFMFVVLYENLSTLVYYCAINCLLLKMEWMVNKEKKKPSYLHFYWFRRTRSFAYVPVRNQNLVVRGRNFFWLIFYFLLVFEKVLKEKAKWQMRICLCFLILKKNGLLIKLNWLMFDLRK